MNWKDIQTPRPYVKVGGDGNRQDLFTATFGILAGRSDNNTLVRLLQNGPTGRNIFINDDCWWFYTDFQCHFHSLYGWRPFCSAEIRRADFSTWSAGFLNQVTKESREDLRSRFHIQEPPPIGWLPAQYSADTKHFVHNSPAMFYNNCASEEETWAFEEDKTYPGYHLFSHVNTHDLNSDYPLMNCISATDWILWERDPQVAQEYLPRIERFLKAISSKVDGTGYFLFGPQGSQIEYGHGGWRHQASTHLYYWRVLRNIAEVHAMLGQKGQARRYQEAAQEWGQKLHRFESGQGWLVSGYNEDFRQTYGNGNADGSASDYLEVWPNVNAAVLGWMDRTQARHLADRFETIPALVENHLTVSNYPARPVEELDSDHDGFPPPGTHLNGGFFWMHGGSALGMYTRGGQPQTLKRLEELLEDHYHHLSVDYYNDWGRNKEKQFPHLPRITHSVTCAGAFGHFFRSLFGLTACADSLRIAPAPLPQIEHFETLEPIFWGGKELRIAVSGKGTIHKVALDGKAIEIKDPDSVEVPFETLPNRTTLRFERK